MKNKYRRTLTKAAALVTVFSLSCAIITQSGTGTYSAALTADEYEDKIDDLQKENEKIEQQLSQIDSSLKETETYLNLVSDKLNNTKDEIDYLNNKIYYKNQEIEAKESEIEDIAGQISIKENDIEAKQLTIVNLQNENDINIEKFGNIVAEMYKTESQDALSVLAGATDFYDLLVRAKLLTNVAQQSVDFMDTLLAEIDRLERLTAELETDKITLENTKDKLETEKVLLVEEKDSLQADVDESNQLSSQYMTEYNEYEATKTSLGQTAQQYQYQHQLNQQEINDYESQLEALIKAATGEGDYIEGDWRWPLDSKYQLITTYYGYDAWRNGNHGGIDVGNSGIGGANIYAAKSGTVIVAKTDYIPGYSYGKYIVIDHGGGITTLYAHCNDIYVQVGQQVSAGDVIGAVGTTGWSTGNHLHFEIRKDGKTTDPLSSAYSYYYV